MTSKEAKKIIVVYSRPPIADRRWDWCCWRDGEEELTVYGHGATEAEALQDLAEQEEDEAETAR